MTILSNHRLHSYKATASSHHRVLTPKKMPMKSTQRRIVINFSTKKTSNINNKTPNIIKNVEEVLPTLLYIEGMNIYEDYFGGWNPQLYEALNQEYDLDNSADYEDYLDEIDNEEAWAHLDYLEWLTD